MANIKPYLERDEAGEREGGRIIQCALWAGPGWSRQYLLGPVIQTMTRYIHDIIQRKIEHP